MWANESDHRERGSIMTGTSTSALRDRLELERGRIALGGVQALVRLLLEQRRAGISVTEIYASYGITDYRRHRTTVYTRAANEQEAAHLMLRPGQPVLIVQKIDVDLNGVPIGFSEATWAGDRVQLTFDSSHTDPMPAAAPAERIDDVQ